MNGQHPIHKAFAEALLSGTPGVIELGRTVLCDGCEEDLTDDPRSGGFMFGSYGYGPCCAIQRLAGIRRYHEERYITAWCPPDVSFADWIRQIRDEAGNNAIIISRAGMV